MCRVLLTLLFLGILEKTIHFTIPLAVIGSIGANPEYNPVMKILKGPLDTGFATYNTVAAYMQNTGVQDYFNDTGLKIANIVGNTVENAISHPLETTIVALTTYVLGRMTEAAVKMKKDILVDNYIQKATEKKLIEYNEM